MPKSQLPHVFTMQMGEQIKKAREEIGLSQGELAKSIKKRQATVSDLENGKSLPTLETLTYLAITLKKPLLYFVGPKYQPMLQQHEELTVEEQEMLIQFRRLSKEHQKIALGQIRTMANIDT